MAKLKYTITMIRTVGNEEFEANTDEECLALVKEYVKEDAAFVCDDVMGNEKDTLTVELIN